MKLTIVETGRPPEPLRQDWPDYPAMFETLITRADDGFSYQTVSIPAGDALPNPAGLDAVLITGSAAGVYDDEPWISPLLDFIRAAAATRTPQFGICFGHQAIAEALGGKVVKSPKGWGVGRHEYAIAHRPGWMAGGPNTFALAVSHQDQVIAAPPGAQVIATSPFCEFAGLAYGDTPAASLQGHPEFHPGFGASLHALRTDRIGHDTVARGVASLAAPLDTARVAGWIAAFFRATARA